MNEYLEFAKKLARDAGAVMLEYFNQCDISHYKADNTIITTADTEINQMVIDRVRAAYPDHGVYGEEDSFGRDKKLLWVCDPIDGTAMFARGVPTAVFSLAFVVDGEPIVGVVYDPFTDRLYTAVKDGGAFCNGEPIKVNATEFSDKKAVSNSDIWPEAEIYDEMSHLIAELNKKTYLVGIGSCINACMQVARGSFVAQVFAGTKGKNVDIAAAKIIVEEAGGRVTNIYGEDQCYDRDIKGAIVSNGIVHDEIIEIIREGLK
jgi:fructose-1,6-bisphosphatase/inositol monophosphatase family enzyme